MNPATCVNADKAGFKKLDLFLKMNGGSVFADGSALRNGLEHEDVLL